MDISILNTKLNELKEELREQEALNNSYRKKVDELGKIYREMQDVKKDMKKHKKEVSKFVEKTYKDWKGNTFKTRYQANLTECLIDGDYEKLLGKIDDNLDALNTEKTKYENLILKTGGIIGHISAGINSLVTEIENFLN